jgi:hypothetical protein
MPGKNIIGYKFSVQNDWLINCKFAARYTSEQNAIKAEQSYAVEECDANEVWFYSTAR